MVDKSLDRQSRFALKLIVAGASGLGLLREGALQPTPYRP